MWMFVIGSSVLRSQVAKELVHLVNHVYFLTFAKKTDDLKSPYGNYVKYLVHALTLLNIQLHIQQEDGLIWKNVSKWGSNYKKLGNDSKMYCLDITNL